MTTTELPHPAAEDAFEASLAPRSMADAPLPACESHSSISTYRACPLRYGFRYVERRPGEVSPGQFAFGNAVHTAFEAFGRARIRARAEGDARARPDVLQAALDRRLARSGPGAGRGRGGPAARGPGPGPVPRARGRHRAPSRWRSSSASAWTWRCAARRERVGPSREPAPVRFVGYVDRVDRAPDGSTEIVDYKTGRRPQPGRRRRRRAAHGLRVRLRPGRPARPGDRRDPAAGVAPRALLRRAGELVWTTRTDEQLAAFEAGLVETVGRIHAREFAARPAPGAAAGASTAASARRRAPGPDARSGSIAATRSEAADTWRVSGN